MKGISSGNNENKQNRGQNIQELRRNDLFLRCVYDASGRLCYKFERAADVVTEYGYAFDAAGHLTKVTRNGAICEEYRYNRAGQRMAQRREGRQGMPLDAEILRYDAQGRLTAAGDVGFDYDGQGALTGRYTRWGVTAFAYGQDTRQGIRLNIAVLPTKAQIRYEYDGIHPVRRYRYLTLTGEYVWQGDRLAAYYDHDLHLEYAFRYADSGVPGGVVLDTVTLRPLPASRRQKFPTDTDWAKECADWLYGMSAESRRQRLWGWLESWHQVSVSNPLTLYAGCDQVSTLRVLTDKFCRLVKAVRRDSFGVLLEDSFADLFMPLGFSGGLEDADTGLVRFGWRDYDPTIGRLTAPDPARDRRGDGDIYDYCVDDPVSRMDPTGQAFSQAAAVAGGTSHGGVSHPFGGPHGQSSSGAESITSKGGANSASSGGKSMTNTGGSGATGQHVGESQSSANAGATPKTPSNADNIYKSLQAHLDESAADDSGAPLKGKLIAASVSETATDAATPPIGQNDISAEESNKVANVAYEWSGTVYLYGGTTRAGADCSGSTAGIAAEAKVPFPRTPTNNFDDLVKKGYVRPLGPNETPRPGDIVLWGKGKFAVGHMGYYAGPDPTGGSDFCVYSALNNGYKWHPSRQITKDKPFAGFYRLQKRN